VAFVHLGHHVLAAVLAAIHALMLALPAHLHLRVLGVGIGWRICWDDGSLGGQSGRGNQRNHDQFS
jgi:hypothetical protein